MRLPKTEVLEKIYGESRESRERFESLAKNFKENFQKEEMEFFTAPGRTEIVGNHTDHNGGKILAASIDMDTIGAAYLHKNASVLKENTLRLQRKKESIYEEGGLCLQYSTERKTGKEKTQYIPYNAHINQGNL